MPTSVVLRPIAKGDFDQWFQLWMDYNTFYKRIASPEVTSTTWARFLDHYEPVHARVAERDGKLLGLVHFIFHRNTSMIGPVCYLQDLFTHPDARGLGIGRALIDAVYREASSVGSTRVYWLTHETNQQAMHLYDQVATRSSFVQYRKELPC